MFIARIFNRVKNFAVLDSSVSLCYSSRKQKLLDSIFKFRLSNRHA